MRPERGIDLITAELAGLAEQLGRPTDLLQFHSNRGSQATYQALLAVLDPVRNMVGPEVPFQRAYLDGVISACERVAYLLREPEQW
jgi:hypothetical protein